MTEIHSGGGVTPHKAIVDEYGHLVTLGVGFSEQRFSSDFLGEAYQVSDNHTFASASTFNILHVENTNTDGRIYIVTYIRVELIDPTGGTGPPGVGSYFSINKGELYSSGGTSLTPTNMNFGSSNSATGKFYGDAPTLTGTATEFDRWYIKAEGEMLTYRKEGSIVIPRGTAMTIKLVTASTAGTAYARVSFVQVKPHKDTL